MRTAHPTSAAFPPAESKAKRRALSQANGEIATPPSPNDPRFIGFDTAAVAKLQDLLAQALGILKQVVAMSPPDESDRGWRGAAGAPEEYRVIENGKVRFVSRFEAEKLVVKSSAHLLLEALSGRTLWWRGPDTPLGTARQKYDLSWRLYRIAYAGLVKPGQPFGPNTLHRLFPNSREITSKSLTRYLIDFRKRVQAGRADGPYLTRVGVTPHVSDSGWGYQFEDGWGYVVIEPASECVQFHQ